MPQEKVSLEIAKKEIESWMDAKRVPGTKRIKLADQIETLEYAVVEGTISIDPDTRVIRHGLMFPVADSNGDVALSKLEYKPRLATNEIQSRLKGITASDGGAVVNAVISALTGQPAAMIGKLDTEDNSIAQAVAVFFL